MVARHGVRLAVENHKDWRADELIALLKRLGNDHVGVCLDTGNSIALLEDPMDVVEALAPWAFTTHFKDMGLEEYRDGFLLAEVPLGTGVLDLPRVVRTLRAAAPDLHFNIEMITRDPLQGAVCDQSLLGDLPRPARAGTSPARSGSSATTRQVVHYLGSATCRKSISSGRKTTTSASAWPSRTPVLVCRARPGTRFQRT